MRPVDIQDLFNVSRRLTPSSCRVRRSQANACEGGGGEPPMPVGYVGQGGQG